MLALCCSKLLRVGYLVLAAPLLLAGTLFHQLGCHLQQSGIRSSEYAAAEWTAAAGLDRQAKQSLATASEDQGLVADMEADVTRHGEAVSANEAAAGEQASVVGEEETAAAAEAGTAAVVQEVPGVNVAADVTEGSAIAGQEATAFGAAVAAVKNEGLALEEGAQASADSGLATEKEVEAESLTAAATTEETASVASKRAAVESTAAAGGFFVEAFFCQLISAVFQLPVLVALFSKWSVGMAGSACIGCADAGILSSSLGAKGLLSVSWMASRLSLVATLSSLLISPWSSTVLAAGSSGGLVSEVGFATGLKADARMLAGNSAHKAKHDEPSFLNGLNPFARPNLATTTVIPTTPAPPHQETRWEALLSAASITVNSIVHWAWPVLVDVGLISAVFAVAGFAFGAGRHGVKRGSWNILRTTLDHWFWGFGLLLAVWVLSIIMASELQPFAKNAQSMQIGSFPITCFAVVCFLSHNFHGHVVSRKESQVSGAVPGGSLEESRRLLTNRDSDRSSTTDSERTSRGADVEAADTLDSGKVAPVVGAISCSIIAAIFELGLQSFEGPLNAWALGGSWKTALLCSSLLANAPWDNVAKDAGNWFHLPPIEVVAMAALTIIMFVSLCAFVHVGGWRWLTRLPPTQVTAQDAASE
jgi:hypothetical protein